MGDRDTLTVLAEELALALQPIAAAFRSPGALRDFLEELGWDFAAVPAAIESLRVPVETVYDLANGTDEVSPDEIGALLDGVRAAFDVISNLQSAGDLPAEFRDEFPRQLVDYLLVEYLLANHPRWGYLLLLVGIFHLEEVPAAGSRPAFLRRVVAFEDLSQLLADPLVFLRTIYDWGGTDFLGEPMLVAVDGSVRAWDLEVRHGTLDAQAVDQLNDGALQPDETVVSSLHLVLVESVIDPAEFNAGVSLFLLPETADRKPGLALLPYASPGFEEETEISDQLSLSFRGAIDPTAGPGILIRPDRDIEFLVGFGSDTLSAAAGNLVFALRLANPGAPFILIGAPNVSRFEVAGASATGGTRFQSNGKFEVFIEFALERGKVVIQPSPSEVDGFLAALLPKDGMQTEVGPTVGFSSTEGLYFRGSGALEISLPVHRSAGPLDLQSVILALDPQLAKGAIPITVGVTIRAHLGPLDVLIEDLGLQANFSFPDDNSGNLGPLDLDVGFKPPDGIGLSIDGCGFKGGGFLSFDKENERYAGILELDYQGRIELKAIGLLTTRLPGGSPGFSLLIIINASNFTPINLGLGFTLNGVGGLLGLNRTAKVERLRSGLRDNTLRSILFPENIIANADRIISDLRQVFPPQDGRFLFGPMAKIGWGSPTLITVDLGLLIEVPQPVRVFILGVARALLPDEKAKLLQLHVNFLGEIDFERELFAFDASLFDSKLLTYTLSGDMAVRLKWGDSDPNFLLTVGGFHPAYDPPPLGLPVLRRLNVQLLSGNNPRLVLETYFAVTSNTAQFGARVELYAAAGKFNVYGFLSFDALFQFNPFYFIADVAAMLALRVGSSSIASIQLSLTLEGTTPWKAQGTATLKLCWFIKIKVRFNKTFGEVRDTRLDDVAVLPLLEAALSDKGNWSAEIPAGRHLLVSVKDINDVGNQVVVHPFGILEISQRVVPLNVEIQTFGNQQPADGNRFAIEQVRVGEPDDTEPLGTSIVREQFAPAQFFEMTDTEKLSRKSFERYDGGVRATASERLEAAYAAKREVDYDLFYIDSQREQRLRHWADRLRPDAVAFDAWASKGAVAASPLSFANNKKSALAPEAVRVIQEQFAVVKTSDLTPVNGAAVADSEAGAFGVMRELIRSNPALEGEIQVVPTFEVN